MVHPAIILFLSVSLSLLLYYMYLITLILTVPGYACFDRSAYLMDHAVSVRRMH